MTASLGLTNFTAPCEHLDPTSRTFDKRDHLARELAQQVADPDLIFARAQVRRAG